MVHLPAVQYPERNLVALVVALVIKESGDQNLQSASSKENPRPLRKQT